MSPPPNRIGIDPTLMTQLIGEIKRLDQAWPDADAQIGRALSSIGASMTGPGTLRDVASQIAQQIPDLQRRLDLIVSTQKIGLDRGVVWADETLWVSNSPASGAAAAKSLAGQLRKAAKDATSGQGTVSEETLDLLEKHRHDPYFSVAFAKEMPPKELKALLERLYLSHRGSLDNDWTKPSSSSVMDRLTRALSVTLGTASRGVGGMKLPKSYVDDLIATDDNPLSGRMVDELLRYGTFDDAFLREVANKVFDNATKPQSQQQDIIAFGPGLAAALANNARVAQDFFTDPARKPLSFLMRDNFWGSGSGELGRAIEAATTRFRDHGQPPGSSRGHKSALIASWAVHFWSDPQAQANLPDTRQSAGRVFTAYMSDVHRVANGTTSEKPGVLDLPDSDLNLPGDEPYGALFDRDELKATMVWASKDTEVFRKVIEAHGEYSLKVLDARGAEIASGLKADFAAWHKSHPGATESEQSEYRQKLLKDAMAGSPGNFFNSQVYALSKSLYFTTDAGNMASINEADRRDRWNKAFTDAITRTTKLALTPAGDIPGAIYEFTESYASDNIKFTEGETARSKAEDKLVQSQNLFKDLTADVMLRHGLFGERSTPGSAHPHAFRNSAKGSEGDFLQDGRIKPRTEMDSTEALAYDQWLIHSSASGIFNSTSQSVQNGFQRPVPPYPEAKE
ncbi:hypothetical protein ACGFI3_34465 [Nonomuraea wenchangensis]|uniref:hypothetical protein n=1 Tax=Nonomuraea wenchangensis TaxID=568860 RepID=UPI00371A1F9C